MGAYRALPAKFVGAVRQRWRARSAEAAAPSTTRLGAPNLQALWRSCRSAKTELFDQGGATIDTPDPLGGGATLFARTVVQPDGDIVCLVGDRYAEDPDLREEHRERVAAWFRELDRTVDGVTGAVRTASRWGSGLVVVVTSVAVTTASSIVVGLLTVLVASVAVPVVVRQAIRFAIGRALR